MKKRTDRELVELAQKGDMPAVGELFSRYWRAARAAAFGVTGEFASAEDAAAEAFKQVLSGIASIRDPERFGPWLRTIVVRKARSGRPGRHSELDAFSDVLPDPNARPDAVLERRQLDALIQYAMRQLPDRLREAIALFYFEGYDSDAAARFLDIPAGTLRRRLHDGRTRLRSVVDEVFQGSKQMNDERERLIQKFKTMIDNGEIYHALRESLTLRPAPSDLVDTLIRRQQEPADFFMEAARRFDLRSARAADPKHPVGAVAAAIRKALPGFQDWQLDMSEAAARFLTFKGEHSDRLRILLPPGFAEGRSGAFVRSTRALLNLDESGAVRSMYENLQNSPDESTFRIGMKNVRVSDVLDLTWMVAGPLELRSVQELLEQVATVVLPGIPVQFSTYDEPRYRSALQLHTRNIPARAACGGVLGEWPGRPQGVNAAHVRIFLEPWATILSGQVVEVEKGAGENGV